tara:strand:+ start:752 stop:919 length:168 start_codon:yes stop_codon:yes gene_type:complete
MEDHQEPHDEWGRPLKDGLQKTYNSHDKWIRMSLKEYITYLDNKEKKLLGNQDES